MAVCSLPGVCGSTVFNRRTTWRRKPIHLVAFRKQNQKKKRGKDKVLTLLSKDTASDQTSALLLRDFNQGFVWYTGFEEHPSKQQYIHRGNLQALLTQKEQRVCPQPVVSTPTHFICFSPKSGKVLFT